MISGARSSRRWNVGRSRGTENLNGDNRVPGLRSPSWSRQGISDREAFSWQKYPSGGMPEPGKVAARAARLRGQHQGSALLRHRVAGLRRPQRRQPGGLGALPHRPVDGRGTLHGTNRAELRRTQGQETLMKAASRTPATRDRSGWGPGGRRFKSCLPDSGKPCIYAGFRSPIPQSGERRSWNKIASRASDEIAESQRSSRSRRRLTGRSMEQDGIRPNSATTLPQIQR
jgi:hypothetical protein